MSDPKKKKDFIVLMIDRKREAVLKLLYSGVYTTPEAHRKFFNTLKRDGLMEINTGILQDISDSAKEAGWEDYELSSDERLSDLDL